MPVFDNGPRAPAPILASVTGRRLPPSPQSATVHHDQYRNSKLLPGNQEYDLGFPGLEEDIDVDIVVIGAFITIS